MDRWSTLHRGGLQSAQPVPPVPPAQQPTYTTAGTVYNPHAAPPIQPPTRRARSRVPNPQADLSQIGRLVGFDDHHRSPPTTVPSLQHYSPLQQNYDRATNPTDSLNDQEENYTYHASEERAFPTWTSGNMPLAGWHPSPPSPPAPESHDSTKDEEDNDFDKADEAQMSLLKHYSTKTVTNLAQYDTSTGRTARAYLERARATAPLAKGQETHRSSTPAFAQHTHQDIPGNSVQSAPMRSTLDPSAYATRVRNNTDDMQQYDGYGSSDLHRQTSRRSHVNGHAAGYTTLSNGPGAPRPLTAGPPGHRQHSRATFEMSMRVLQESSRHLRREAGEARSETYLYGAVSDGRPTSTNLPRPASPYETISMIANNDGVVPSVYHDHALHSRDTRITDTLPREAAQQYYPDGFPENYNERNVTAISSRWQMHYDFTGGRSPRVGMSREEQLLQDAKIDTDFYAGTSGLGKTIDNVLAERQRKQFDRRLGFIGDGRDRAANRQLQLAMAFNVPSSKSQYPQLSIEDVKRQKTSDAAKPLIDMAFATLLNDLGEGTGSEYYLP